MAGKLLKSKEFLVVFLNENVLTKVGLVTHACSANTREAEAGGSRV
jgi:hypothetical protein